MTGIALAREGPFLTCVQNGNSGFCCSSGLTINQSFPYYYQ